MVWILLHLICQVYYCETRFKPYVSFRGDNLANHSYVNLSLVDNTDSGSVQCHTDRVFCCSSAQSRPGGHWYFPNGSQLLFPSSRHDIYETRTAMRIQIHRRHNRTASGIYRCTIPTVAVQDVNNESVGEDVYVGLYATGGQ